MPEYMTPQGDFAASCQEGTPSPHPKLIAAPPGGGFGMHWDGVSWAYDPDADARAEAFMSPGVALAAERAAMVADKWQVVAALQLINPALWPRVLAFRASADCDAVTAAAIDFAIRLPRLSETIDMFAYLLDLDAEQTDAVFRLAMQIRG